MSFLAAVLCLYTGMTTDRYDPSAPTSPLLDVNDVAERLCVTTRFIRRLVDERRIPFCKLGKFVRFDPADVDAWIQSHRVEAAAIEQGWRIHQ